ncbi:MAG: alpha/beta hydrolase [Candidatus Bathyarchaeota archaeon]|nr:alpha/beta hydrolase [Candidatus Termiticorpusculum sp.]
MDRTVTFQMYIKVNEVKLFFTKSGQGNPIILLHGNGEDHTIFDVLTEQLSKEYTVYAIDSRDHGKSSRVKNLDYQSMMEDIAAFIQKLNIQNPILYGFSDGGILGILLAIKYPDMLSKLIISGANTHPNGIKTIYTILLKIAYFFTRNRKFKLMLTQPNITEEDLNKIITPILVLAGSKDVVKDEHTRMIAKNIKNSVLQVIKGEGHTSYVVHSKKLYDIINPFLTS